MSMTEQHSVSNGTHLAGFENLILQLSQCFLNIPLEGLDAAIIRAMRLVSEYCHADRAVIYSCDWDSLTASHLFEWDSNPEYYIGDRLKTLRLPEFETGIKLPADGQLYSRSSSEEHPDNIILKQLTEEADVRDLCAFPIIMGDRTAGVTVFSTTDRKKEWARNELTGVLR